MAQLFFINNTDFTPFITVPSYKVSEFDESEDWEDGNKRKHTYIVRTRIKGTFTLKFQTPEQFNNFFSVVETNKIRSGEYSGACLTTLFVNNKNAVRSAYIRINADPADTLPLFNGGDYDGFEVTVEEV